MEEIAGDGFGEEMSTLAFDESHEPCHGLIGVDNGSKMFVCVDDPVIRIDTPFLSKSRVAFESLNTSLHDLLHLLVLSWILLDSFAEKEIGAFHASASCFGEVRICGNGGPNVVGLETPSLGMVKGYGIGMLS